jgi:ABC-type polysaccharide/polyol phosphate transport system ATPase subunit
MAAALTVRDLSKAFRIPSVRRDTVREHVFGLWRPRTFERLTVLEDVSFEIGSGEAVAILGRNGCGKSTLLRIIAGIYPPDRGAVRAAAPLTPILELGVGWNPELDALDNIHLIGSVMGLSRATLRDATDSILAFAELERFANLPLKHYSTGMAARLAYAVAFTAVRDILLLDEIFAVGDAGFRARCEERVRALHAAGHTVVLVTHDPRIVRGFCTRALLFDGGRIVGDGAAVDVVEDYLRLVKEPVDG